MEKDRKIAKGSDGVLIWYAKIRDLATEWAAKRGVRPGEAIQRLAEEAGVTHAYVYQLMSQDPAMKGSRNARVVELIKIAAVLGVGVDDLIVWEIRDPTTGEKLFPQ